MSATISPGVRSLDGRRRGSTFSGPAAGQEGYGLPLSAPERSLSQRMEALQKANDIRSQRSALKRDIKAGRQDAIRLLVDPPEYIATMKVNDLLLAAPKVGRVKANKLLSQAKASPSKTVAGLSERQRGELATGLGARRRTQ